MAIVCILASLRCVSAKSDVQVCFATPSAARSSAKRSQLTLPRGTRLISVPCLLDLPRWGKYKFSCLHRPVSTSTCAGMLVGLTIVIEPCMCGGMEYEEDSPTQDSESDTDSDKFSPRRDAVDHGSMALRLTSQPGLFSRAYTDGIWRSPSTASSILRLLSEARDKVRTLTVHITVEWPTCPYPRADMTTPIYPSLKGVTQPLPVHSQWMITPNGHWSAFSGNIQVFPQSHIVSGNAQAQQASKATG